MMSTHATERLAQMVGASVSDMTAVGGGDICQAFRVTTSDGRNLFAKTLTDPPEGFFAAEAEGLRWLAAAPGGVAVPQVVAVEHECLVLEWIEPGSASSGAAEQLGRALAATHGSGTEAFGSQTGDGWIGTLRLPGGPWPDWARMWGHGRIEPYLRAARDRGSVNDRDAANIDRLIEHLPELSGPPEPPSPIHGDLWAGNVLWAADGTAWLIDPAAHGGHRETDLAMLALFGLPHLDRMLAAYQEVWPLADGWRERTALHQLHPVLVHAVLFGGSYGSHAGSLARQVLAG